jgi:hypothetical protein
MPRGGVRREAMSEIKDGTTIGAIFTTAVSAHGDRPFLAVPANDARGYLSSGFEITYGDAGKRVDELAAVYRMAGYGLATAWRLCWRTVPSTSFISWP